MIAILSDPGVGGTFLSWTLHYLAGHNQYWNCDKMQLVDLPASPLTHINAHNFQANQPTSLATFQNIIKAIGSNHSDKFATVYFHDFRDSTETQQAVDIIQTCADKLILLTQSSNTILYTFKYENRGGTGTKFGCNTVSSSSDDAYKNFVDYFFTTSSKTWQDLQLTQIWDKREFIALNFDPLKITSIKPFVNYTTPHYNIDVVDHWNMLDTMIPDLFNNLGLVIDQSRVDLWLGVYREWQQIHRQQQRFVWYFEKIVDYILNGYAMNLEQFNLDIIQEAMIQRELIYQYGLNFKTWQLEKFQTTQQLHALLEPNIHLLT